VLRRWRHAQPAELCGAGLRFTTGGEVTTGGRFVSCPRASEHLAGWGIVCRQRIARAGFIC